MRTCKNCPNVKAFKKYLKNALKAGPNFDADEETGAFDCKEDAFENDDFNEMIADVKKDASETDSDVGNQDESEYDGEDESEYDGEEESSESESEGDDDEEADPNEKMIHYRQWVSTDRCEFKHFAEPVSEFVNDFAVKLEKLVTHTFIANQQAAFLKHLQTILKAGEFIIWGDFSENFSFVLQNEAQGYYWAKKQATIHPFIIYYKNSDNELKHLSYVIISECLKHDSVSVYLFITKLIKFLESKFKVITKLFYFTDGCAGQYKNRKNFLNVYCHKIDFGYECEWHFHATSHGKGPCDGIGGTLKRTATRVSLARPYENQIDYAELLFQWASSSNMNINFDYSSNAEYNAMVINLENRFNDATTINGTLKYHCFIPKANGELLVKFYSFATDHKMVKIIKK